MENQEADQKFRSCPWVSNTFLSHFEVIVWSAVLEFKGSGDCVNVYRRSSWKWYKWGRIWEWLA